MSKKRNFITSRFNGLSPFEPPKSQLMLTLPSQGCKKNRERDARLVRNSTSATPHPSASQMVHAVLRSATS